MASSRHPNPQDATEKSELDINNQTNEASFAWINYLTMFLGDFFPKSIWLCLVDYSCLKYNDVQLFQF